MLVVASISAVLVVGVGATAIAIPRGDATVRWRGRSIVVHPHGRFGVFPTEENATPGSALAAQLRYGGGVDGIGVTTGAPKVYVVYWGTQWGSSSINGSGYMQFTGDPVGFAPDQQAFFAGLGTGNELWDGVMTQYC